MKRYLKLVTLEEALERMRSAFAAQPRIERVPVEESSGRITASPIFARFSVPAAHLAAMDGIAVRSGDTAGAGEQHPVTLPNAVRVNTGNVVPADCDAVVMIEDVWEDGGQYRIRKPVSPWQHVRPIGEDIGESEMILPSAHRIRPFELGALSAFGVTEVDVIALRAALIPTGSELVPRGSAPAPGQVVESNTLMAAAWLSDLGVTPCCYPITPDEPDLIRTRIEAAVEENDLVIVSAGSSAGTRDFTAGIVAELGEVLVHGVAIKPGKPLIIGRVQGKPLIGLPGYPLSALTVLREIVTPLVAMYGFPPPQRETLRARLSATLTSEIGTLDFVFLTVGRIGDAWVAVPRSRGAGVQMSAVRSNACLRIPEDREGFEAGAEVEAELMVPRERAGRALLVVGSHDPALDHLADCLQRRAGVEMHSVHAGSMGGLLALKRQECHAAPMHLLGPEGDYNVPYLRKYMPDARLALVTVALREQGILSRSGIGFEELPMHTFVNRQRGSGTRILFDRLLAERGMDPGQIAGYDREVTTHLAVALAVKSGEADAGMGVYSAARALGLEFVAVARERYELALHRDTLEDGRVQAMLAALRSEPFREVLRRLGGYDTTGIGALRELP